MLEAFTVTVTFNVTVTTGLPLNSIIAHLELALSSDLHCAPVYPALKYRAVLSVTLAVVNLSLAI